MMGDSLCWDLIQRNWDEIVRKMRLREATQNAFKALDREPTEMELRVAQAIVQAEFAGETASFVCSVPVRDWVPLARAAILAMRVPTPQMIAAGLNCCNGDGERHKVLPHEYQNMIDAASPGASCE